MPLAYQMDLMLKIKASSILRVAAIDQEYKRHHVALRFGGERNATQGFEVDGGYLFAFAQIRDGGLALRRRYPIGDAATGAATVEAKNEAWFFRSAAVDKGVHA